MALIRSFATVGFNTLLSRVTGFVRDILVAAALGTGPIADAFVVAFRMPNLFRSLFAEGAFNSSFTPLFARRLEEGGVPAAKSFAEECLSALLLGVFVFTLAAEIAMPWLMHLIAPGFRGDPSQFELATHFTRVAFPYLIFMTLVALFAGMLNSFGRYGVPAAAPILLNVVQVIMVLFFSRMFPTVGHALVWGVVVAGIAQFLALLWDAGRAGAVPRLRMPRLTPGVKRLLALALPGVVASGITQVNILVGTLISTYEAGAPAILYYADRVYQLPLGVIGIAVGVVLLPTLTRRLRSNDDHGAQETQNRALEFSMLLTLPCAVAIAVIPLPITTVLFERGAFGAEDSARTAETLIAFAAGLPAFVLIKALTPGYFAREDTATPLKFAAASIAVNVATSLVLFFIFRLGALSIAIATALAGWTNTLQLGVALVRRGHLRLDRRLLSHLPRMLAASAVMGLCLYGLERWLWRPQMGIAAEAGTVALFVAAGIIVYALASLLFKTTTIRELAEWAGFAR